MLFRSGTLLGSWTTTSPKTPTGITIDPSGASQSIWVVDNGTDRVYEYTNARTRISGSQAAASSFALAAGNTTPTDIADPLSFPASTSVATAGSSSVALVSAPPRIGTAQRDVSAVASAATPSRPSDDDSAAVPISKQAAVKTPDEVKPTRSPVKPKASISVPLSLDNLFTEENLLTVLQNV